MNAKQFLLAFAGVYALGVIAGLVFFGSPGYSRAYLDQYGEEHAHYLEAVDTPAYQLYIQRPHLIEQEYERNPHLHPTYEHLKELLPFIEQYESRPEYQAEKRRVTWYRTYLEAFNALGVVVLAVWFGRKPLMAFISQKAAEAAQRIEQAEAEKQQAEAMRLEANARIDGLPAEQGLIARQTDESIKQTVKDIQQGAELLHAQMREEAEARKQAEYHRAAMALKADLVDKAIDQLSKQLKEGARTERQTALINHFVKALDAQAQERSHG